MNTINTNLVKEETSPYSKLNHYFATNTASITERKKNQTVYSGRGLKLMLTVGEI
jgi:hypothetical protein